MKKKLCILLAIMLTLSALTACGNTDKNADVSIKPDDGTVSTQPTNPDETTKPSNPSDDTQTPDDGTEEEWKPGEIIEIIPSDNPAAEGDFGTSSAFSGIYKITGYSYLKFGAQLSYNIYLEGVDNNNEGDFDASKTNIPSTVGESRDYVYIKLTFEGDKLTDWRLIDKLTHRDLGQPTEEQLNSYIFPEKTFEEVPSGKLPENQILLSNYEIGKTYVFDLELTEDGGYSLPEIINDTDKEVLIISTKIDSDDDWEREFKINKKVTDNFFSFSGGTSDEGKFYMAIIEGSVEQLIATEDYVAISDCEIGKEIDMGFDDYIYNDTLKTVTLSCNNIEYTLKPGEVIKCSWMNDVTYLQAE